jgi:hypothetical protein
MYIKAHKPISTATTRQKPLQQQRVHTQRYGVFYAVRDHVKLTILVLSRISCFYNDSACPCLWRFYFNSFSWDGVRLFPLSTSATIRPIVPAPHEGWWVWSSRWNDWQEKQKYSKKTCPSAALSATNPIWSDLGSNLCRRGGKPVTNRLRYDAASYLITMTQALTTLNFLV